MPMGDIATFGITGKRLTYLNPSPSDHAPRRDCGCHGTSGLARRLWEAHRRRNRKMGKVIRSANISGVVREAD